MLIPVTGGQEDNDVAFTATQLLAGFTDAESDISELTIAGISASTAPSLMTEPAITAQLLPRC